ncbi:MAG: purine-nucleoside phosphorylase [Clostridia bacterium]|nr:purine-nucleoside phosphorylase [Clostridia bacterium]
MNARLKRCIECVRAKVNFKPQIAIVLGSGLVEFAETIDIHATMRYGEIDGFPISTAPGHPGKYVFGYIGDIPVVIMQGRVHYYEGYSMSDVVLPIRLMGSLGASALVLTNAAGAVNPAFSVGDFMILRDHISLFVPSPLIGKNDETLGTRFPDMSNVYDAALRECAHSVANVLDIELKEGIYVQLTGPSYETPAEIRMLRALGADAVGMSTVAEAIAARHMGLRVCAISAISNLASGMKEQTLSHEDIMAMSAQIGPTFHRLLDGIITGIAREVEQ